MVEFDRSAFIGKFQEESGEYLQRLNENVIRLESEPDDPELVDQMLRDAHTLKGSSRMVGLMEISDIAHRLEDLMVKIRDKEINYSPNLSDIFFEALDVIMYLSEHAAEGVPDELDLPGLMERLTAVVETGAPPEEADEKKTKKSSCKAKSKKGAKKGKKTAKKKPEDAEEETPEGEMADVEDQPEDLVEAGVETEGPEPAGSSRKKAGAETEEVLRRKVQPTIRIRTAQVDELLNLVSEVVITRIKTDGRLTELRLLQGTANETAKQWARLKSLLAALGEGQDVDSEDVGEAVDYLDDLLGDLRRDLASFVKSYSDDASRASTVINDLQEAGMRLRMLPVSTVFNAFPRAVHDLAREFGKEVELVIEGETTELDKKVLEEINDPLIHIMRNAVDHGIEQPEERERLGKPRKGTVKLAARQEGDHIVIEISDDGAGIDPDKVRASAVKKGYLTQAEAAALSDREARFLIFEPGFSTSAIITEISGRGVGMDVVREFIVEKLKGSMHVESEVGQGTTFKLTIPLTLAIIRALILSVGDQIFAVPTSNIEETIRIEPTDVIRVEGREIIRRQRRNVPLVRLGDVLGVEHQRDPGAKVPVVVVGFSGHRLGFIADAFRGEQQIVIKSLGSHLRKVENVAGVTVLGAGEVVPILNVPDLMANARRLAAVRARTLTPQEGVEVVRRILICEDSFTTRELERSIFEAAGYEVEAAADGQEGLDKLRAGLQVDAVVTDVQMPNLDGFELTRSIKQDDRLSEIPVIIVTSLEREEEKQMGIEAGADAYITKSVFNQDMLLDTVERLIH
ncbi:MAG: hypothetical protein Kow0056_14890 [Coriobacteriia bacterium]